MSLELHLKLIGLNADWERFAEVYGDDIEESDNLEFIKEIRAITGDFRANPFFTLGTVNDGFNYCDLLAQTLEEETQRESPHIKGTTKQAVKLVYQIKYSINKGWFDDWEAHESDLFDLLDNMASKNYEPIGSNAEFEADKDRIFEVLSRARRRAEEMLFEDIQAQEIEIVEKCKIIKRFAEEYEPNLEPCEWFEGFAHFDHLGRAKTYGELLENIAEWCNAFSLVEYGVNGEVIEAETVGSDYIYLVGGF